MSQFLSTLKGQTKTVLTGGLLLAAQIFVSAQCSTTGWKKVSQGENYSIALKEDGTIWIWGQNTYGLLGNGSAAATEIKHPTQIGTDANWTDISTGRNFALAIKGNGDLYGWGANYYGEQGLGHNTDLSAPTLIQQNVKAFSAGYYHTLIVKTDGTLWGAGYNDYSGLGVGTSTFSYNTFQQEATKATNWASVTATYYNSFAIKTDGTLWSAGANAEGQNGLGTPASVGSQTDTFTQVGTDTNWKAIAGGLHHTLGLKTNGELWSWGRSLYGNLGLGNTTQYFTPQQIPGTTWAAIGATNESSSALKTDGSLWTWGYNGYGILGIGTTTSVSTPTKVGTENTWKNIPVRSGENSSGGIKTDTALFTWGADSYWQLGNNDGTATNSSVPTQVTCVDNQLAVNDVSSGKKLSIYPNPAKDFVVLQSARSISEVKIYNVAGALVKSISNIASDNKVNVSDLSVGVYIVKINNSAEGVKLIKK